jgi:hypothetical protein
MGIKPQVKKTHGEAAHLQTLATKAMECDTLGCNNGRDKIIDSLFLHLVQNDGEFGQGAGTHVLNLVSHRLLALPSDFFHSFPARDRKQE